MTKKDPASTAKAAAFCRALNQKKETLAVLTKDQEKLEAEYKGLFKKQVKRLFFVNFEVPFVQENKLSQAVEVAVLERFVYAQSESYCFSNLLSLFSLSLNCRGDK